MVTIIVCIENNYKNGINFSLLTNRYGYLNMA